MIPHPCGTTYFATSRKPMIPHPCGTTYFATSRKPMIPHPCGTTYFATSRKPMVPHPCGTTYFATSRKPMVGFEPTTYSFVYTSILLNRFMGGLDCIFSLIRRALCQSFERYFYLTLRSWPHDKAINRNSGFTLALLLEWAGSSRSTMELLYQLSYIGTQKKYL